jgi:hypothetical protein
MLALRLVRLIEAHSEPLARSLMLKVVADGRCADYGNVPPGELQARVREIYRHVGDWLVNRGEDTLRKRYTEIGVRRFHQNVSAGALVWAILAVKEHLIEFLESEGFVDDSVELVGEFELFRQVDSFFDRAVYYAVCGHEQERAAMQEQQVALSSA